MAALLAAAYWNGRTTAAGRLARHLPESVSTVLHVDVGALMKLGGWPAIEGTEEADYRRFVDATGFQYQRDLTSLVVGFDGPHTYLLASGKFDWARIQAYAKAQGGACQASQCRMPGSTPGRWVAWFPLRDDLMAMASSPDPAVVNHLAAEKNWVTDAPEPRSAVWVAMTRAAFADAQALPGIVRPFAGLFAGVDRVVFSLEHQGAGPRVKLAARCQKPADATALANNLLTTAIQLSDLDARQRGGGLNEMLSRGSFEARGREVVGHWPLPASLLKAD